MRDSVNLRTQNIVAQKPSQIRVYTLVFFAITFGISLILIVINLGLKMQNARLDDRENEVITAINNQADKKIKMLVISDRLKNITRVMADRGDINTRITSLFEIYPQNMVITGLDGNPDTITIESSTGDLRILNAFLEEQLPDFIETNTIGVRRVSVASVQARGGSYISSVVYSFEELE